MSKFTAGVDQDRRTSVRVPTRRPGKVLCGAFAWDCVIRDVSSQGVKIQMLAGATPPDQMQLVDIAEGQAHDVVVAWRRDRELGLRILRTYDLRGLAPAAAGVARRIWRASRSETDPG
ncbi:MULTISPECIES: PilZ domain-containing protein [Caulobacter]|uniref:PilZ domain-containing protein n=1 Tax=Caulobacter TaxID=75 RepID=UPI0005505C15|nr:MULTISPECIES: PilZ domain-containing protein [Caulobacter]MBQ1561144.1 PilZ domain-containing protein [Caulobacter sp.]